MGLAATVGVVGRGCTVSRSLSLVGVGRGVGCCVDGSAVFGTKDDAGAVLVAVLVVGLVVGALYVHVFGRLHWLIPVHAGFCEGVAGFDAASSRSFFNNSADVAMRYAP